MNYKLFVREHCPACQEVKSFLERNNLDFDRIDLDKDPKSPEAQYVQVVPALFHGSKLMAYGADIITYLSSVNKVARSA